MSHVDYCMSVSSYIMISSPRDTCIRVEGVLELQSKSFFCKWGCFVFFVHLRAEKSSHNSNIALLASYFSYQESI